MQAAITRLALGILIVATLSSCRRAPEFTPRLILQGEEVGGEFWLSAPYIAVVKINKAILRGPREAAFRGGPKTLQLLQFDAELENTIKGDLRNGKITFYFFLKLDQKPTYYLDPGKRYIISLRSEGHVLRSWADGTQLKIEVHSGSHQQKDLPLALGPAVTIAYILLTPGTDCDISTFANTLDWPPYSFGGPAYVNERLKQLQLSPDPTLSDSACIAAAAMFWHHPECLAKALHSADGTIRRAAQQDLQTNDTDLPTRLRDNPASLFPTAWREYVSQMFEIYAEDQRPEVRKAACESLRSIAPRRIVPQCQ